MGIRPFLRSGLLSISAGLFDGASDLCPMAQEGLARLGTGWGNVGSGHLILSRLPSAHSQRLLARLPPAWASLGLQPCPDPFFISQDPAQ